MLKRFSRNFENKIKLKSRDSSVNGLNKEIEYDRTHLRYNRVVL